jgi:glycosyltransferase involved in cell wall biosynthesis
MTDARAEVLNIGPSVMVNRSSAIRTPFRFIFVGTDQLTQNRLTIDYLIDLWARKKPSSRLTLYGQQTREIPLPEGVSVAGYIDDLGAAYDEHSIMLTPSFLPGGVKTKVLEAFSYGRPVVANAATFEGMDLTDYPLVFDDLADLEALVLAPDDYLETATAAATVGSDYLKKSHAPDRTAIAWRHAMLGKVATIAA